MEQTITAKLQILVNPSDKQILCDTMKAYSDACNYVSEYIYKSDAKEITKEQFIKILLYGDIK